MDRNSHLPENTARKLAGNRRAIDGNPLFNGGRTDFDVRIAQSVVDGEVTAHWLWEKAKQPPRNDMPPTDYTCPVVAFQTDGNGFSRSLQSGVNLSDTSFGKWTVGGN